jgi:hypothetical protein
MPRVGFEGLMTNN